MPLSILSGMKLLNGIAPAKMTRIYLEHTKR